MPTASIERSRPQRVRWLLIGVIIFVLAVVAGRFLATRFIPVAEPSIPPPTPTPTATTLADLTAPTCLDAPLTELPDEFAPVDCAGLHRTELVAQVPIAEALELEDKYERPRDKPLSAHAMLACQQADAFAEVSDERLAQVEIVAVWPTKKQWQKGMRDYACFVTADTPWQGAFNE